MALQSTKGFMPVLAALAGNVLVTLAKFAAAVLSGSSVMFSEAVHSAADTLNEILLLIGLQRSLKKANDTFEYGYGNERFFWALLSACGIFFVGAGVTAYRGITALTEPSHIEFDLVVVLVLIFSFVVESYTLLVAARDVKNSMPHATWSARLAAADTSTLAVILEDTIAVIGVVIAATALALSYFTGNGIWDAAGSLLIAALLAAIAIILIIKNRSFLIGRSMPEWLQDEVLEMLAADPAVERVIDFKSIMLGWDAYRIKFEIEFNGTSLLRNKHGETPMREEFEEINGDFETFKRFLADYADRIPRLMGRKIDEIEKRIKERYPSIRHIDIEIN
jgi:zinc transporter 9